jgi:hypothetical protein
MRQGILAVTLLLLLAGCTPGTSQAVPKQPIQKVPQAQLKSTVKPVAKKPLPVAPKNEMTLREVDDTNFNPEYMYPEDKTKNTSVSKSEETPTAETLTEETSTDDTSADTMDKEECIAMISQEKFDKYTAMLGSEDASIKRCKMLKAMR